MLTGTNLTYTKAYNHRIVLETIRLFGPLSRADVARRTALTAQTISNIVAKLLDARLIREGTKRQRGRGAPSITLEINPAGAYSVGLDLDRDHLTGVLVDFSGAVQQRLHYELHFPSPDEAIDLMAATTEALLDQQGLTHEQVNGIGIGFPGPIEIMRGNVATNVVNPKAFPGWEHVPVVDLLSERLPLPVFLENNATAAAIGEHRYGAGQHIATFFYVFFGVGLGGGIILNGQPYEGHTGNAGELGLIPTLTSDGTEAGPPHHVGEYFNLPRLYQALQQHGASATKPADLLALFDEGHPQLMTWMETAAQKLAPLLLAVEYLIDPEAIFLGGRLPDPMIEDLLARLDALLPRLRIEGKSSAPALSRATAGADAAALGVATLPIYEFFAPAPRLLMKRQAEANSPLPE